MPKCGGRMIDKWQTAIYKIRDNFSINDLTKFIKDKHYSSQRLQISEKDGYTFYLFHSSKDSYPKWKNFFQGIVEQGQDILKHISKIEGFVLLLNKKSKSSIYAITGGIGYFAIQDFVDSQFGIDILSRLIKKEDKIIKAVKENSTIGSVLGSIKYFRTHYNLYENDSFGKIYQELKATLNKNLLTQKFGFSEADIKKDSFCIAKSSFKINKSINFDQMLKIINGCESILENEAPIIINNVIKLNKKKDRELIEQLKESLFDLLWQRFNSNGELFDLCHKDFEKYLTAWRYEIRKKQSKKNLFTNNITILDNIDIIFDTIKDSNLLNEGSSKKNEFINLLSELMIYSFDENDNELTKGLLIEHIFGNVNYKGKQYFYINNVWYRIEDDFIKSLNNACNSFIKTNWFGELNHTWNSTNNMKENDYNREFIGDENTIVLDKIVPDNIELCDILKWDDDNIYLIHVKAGFDNSMRDICSQVFISASRLTQNLNDNKEYIDKVYNTLKNKLESDDKYFAQIAKQTHQYTKKQFKKIFEKQINYVLAIFDTASSKRDLRNVENFNSNIAKFSLQELIKEMKAMDIKLKITQIKAK